MHTALGQEHEERVLFRGGEEGDCPMQGHCVVSMYALKLLLSSGRLTLIVLRHFGVAFPPFLCPTSTSLWATSFRRHFPKTLLMLILFEKLRAKNADFVD